MVLISQPGQERARAILAVEVFMLVLPWPFLVLRLYARRLSQVKLCFNDWAIIAGTVLAAGSNVNLIVASIAGGNGERISDITPSEGKVLAKTTYSATLLWPTANTAVRLSFLHFYKTVFISRKLTHACYFIAALCTSFWVCEFIVGAVICLPVRSQWDSSVHGHCMNIRAYYLAGGIINLFLDISILILPQPVLWRLHMSMNRKISLSIVFGLGACTCIVSIFRCIAIGIENTEDISYSEIGSAICSALEPTLGVIVACLPLMLPVFARVKKSRLSTWIKSVPSSRHKSAAVDPDKLDVSSDSTSEELERPPNNRARTRASRWPHGRLEDPSSILDTSVFTVSNDQDESMTQSNHRSDPLNPGGDRR